MDVSEIVALIAGVTRAADVVAGWLATYALHSTVWITLAWWLATRRSLRQAPRAQHAVWTTALVAGFATTIVQLAGGFTPLGGEVRLFDGAQEGMAKVRLLVQREGTEKSRLSLGAGLGANPPWVTMPVSLDRGRELVVIRKTREGGRGKGEGNYRFDAGVELPHSAARGDALLLTRRGNMVRPFPSALPILWSVPFPSVPQTSQTSQTSLLSPVPSFAPFNSFPSFASFPRVAPMTGGFPITLPLTSRDTRIEATVVTTPWSLVIVALWGVGCAILLLRLRLAGARLERTLVGRVDARDTIAGSVLRELVKNAGVNGEITLTTTDRLGIPAAIPGNEICLPRRVLAELTPLEQESLLAHELAHVIRRDTLWLRMGRLIESIAWFQPLNGVASRHMQLAAEFAADEWAVGMTKEPLRLAKCLARVAGWLTPRSTVLAPAMVESQGSPLVQRVRRLTTPPTVPHDGGRALRPAVLVLALAAVSLVAVAPSIAVGHSMAGRNAAFDIGDREMTFIVMDRRDASFDRRTIFTRPIAPRRGGVLRFVVAADGAGE